MLSVQDTQQKCKHEEDSGEPAGEFHQHIGRLSAEYILSHAPAERSAKTLALGPLHQDDQGHQQCDHHVDGKENVDEYVHFPEAGIWLNTSKWQTHNQEGRHSLAASGRRAFCLSGNGSNKLEPCRPGQAGSLTSGFCFPFNLFPNRVELL